MLEQLNYELAPQNIAAEPREVRLGSRDLGRLLVVDRATGSLDDAHVLNLDRYLQAGDVLVLNDSKRLPGVLKTRLEGGAQVELRIVELTSARSCTARPYPTHFVRPGVRLLTPDGVGLVVVETGIGPHGLCAVEAETALAEILHHEGLPITSFYYKNYWELNHYNPVYAASEGSVESPLAGLHFTDRLLARLRAKGVIISTLTLHVVGSWLPLLKDQLTRKEGPAEHFDIPISTANAVEEALANGRRVTPVGSTSMRALESAAAGPGLLRHGSGVSTLFLQPGSQFQIANAYFTNFHQAQSSLMVLDAAFCGVDPLLKAYRYAQSGGYLFHEFGDAVLYV